MLLAECDCRRVHDFQIFADDFFIAERVVEHGVWIFFGVVTVDTIDTSRLEYHISFKFQSSLCCGSISGNERVSYSAREDDNSSFFKMPDGTPTDERLGDLVHGNGGHHACLQPLRLDCILHCE